MKIRSRGKGTMNEYQLSKEKILSQEKEIKSFTNSIECHDELTYNSKESLFRKRWVL
jgi:hypothetical protein